MDSQEDRLTYMKILHCALAGLLFSSLALAQDDPKMPPVPSGLKALESDDPRVRYEAAEILTRLGKVGRFALPKLQERLVDDNAFVRVKVAEAIVKIDRTRAEEVMPVLLRALREENPALRAAVAAVLAFMGPDAGPAVPALVRTLKDKDLDVRIGVVMALGEIGPAARPSAGNLLALAVDDDFAFLEPLASVSLGNMGAVAELIEACGHQDNRVRRLAISALLVMGADAARAVPALATALNDKEPQVRALAVKTLGRIGARAKTTAPQLQPLLADRAVDVCLNATLAIWQLGGTTDLSVPLNTLRDGDANTRRHACEVLGAIRPQDPAVVKALIQAFEKADDELRPLYAQTLGELGTSARLASAKLQSGLKDASAFVRVECALALWRIDKSAEVGMPALKQGLATDDALLQQRAANILGEIGPAARSATAALISAVREGNPRVREAAALALKRIDAAAAIKAGIR